MQNIIYILSSVVIFLFSITQQPIGTGFIVGYPISEDASKIIPIVITAKHVIGDNNKILGRFSTKEGEVTAFVKYDIENLKQNNDYWEHPSDEGVDISAFRTLHFNQAEYNAVPLELIATKDIFNELNICETDRIIFPSMLINFMGLSKNYPVVRNGTIALIPKEKVPLKYKVGSKEIITKQEVILVDATSIPGASGSPIFLWPGPRLKNKTFQIGGTKSYLIGIMHGFYPAWPQEIIELETIEAKAMYQENSGIAIIFPSWKLNDIFKQEKFLNRIEELKSEIENKQNSIRIRKVH